VGTLRNEEAWRAYKVKFVSEAGRVVDTANGMISHSEGQGYGLLLAVAAGDRSTFERIWGWTRANLAVRNDALLAWRWEPDRRPAVADMNDAANGDILVTGLAEAAEAWSEEAIGSRAAELPKSGAGSSCEIIERPTLLPAVAGFAAEDSRRPIANLSHYIFRRSPASAWWRPSRLGRPGQRARFIRRAGSVSPSPSNGFPSGKSARRRGFAADFAYNSIRSRCISPAHGRREHYELFRRVVEAGAHNLATPM
jgi:endoglucanase